MGIQGAMDFITIFLLWITWCKGERKMFRKCGYIASWVVTTIGIITIVFKTIVIIRSQETDPNNETWAGRFLGYIFGCLLFEVPLRILIVCVMKSWYNDPLGSRDWSCVRDCGCCVNGFVVF